MKLAFATMKYYPFGGLERSFLNICKEALRRQHDLTIYCNQWEGDRLEGAEIVELPLAPGSNHARLAQFHRQVMARRAIRPDDVFVGFKRMPDLDLYYNGDACFLDEAAKKHGRWYRLTPRYKNMAAFEQAVFGAESHTEIFYISAREKESYQRYYGTPEARFHELPAGIDKQGIRSVDKSVARLEVRARLGTSQTDTVALMVGSDFRRKGVDRAIRALAALKRADVSLWVVGAGKAKPQQTLARKLGIEQQVKFLGGRGDVPALLAAADILFHPAVIETAGNAILEGMVAGLPVIVSASAGFSSHVAQGDAGIVVADHPFHQALFESALRELVSNPVRARQLGENGFAYADRADLYHRPQVATDIIEMIVRRKAHAVDG